MHLGLSKLKSKWLFLISFILLFILSAYRDFAVGTDTLNYQVQFQVVESGQNLKIEPLWHYLIKLIVLLNGDFRSLLIVSSLLTLLPIFFVVLKVNKLPIFSIFLYITLYYYFYSFNIVRQSIAMSWVLLALYFLADKNTIKFLLFASIAGLFHYSAFIILPAVIVLNRFFKLINPTLVIFSSFFIGLFLSNILLERFTSVFYSDYTGVGELNFLGNMLYLLLLNTIFFMVSNFIKEKDAWFQYFYLFVIFANLLSRVPYGGRLVMFLGITQIIFLPFLISNNKLEPKNNSLVVLFIILYSYINYFMLLGAGEIFPYSNEIL
ncbi:EpsG family protein [Sphingobacterium cellulitidis]|uniref:EpsG family protein n=1 Tax=Sphingobacterium cellulitidis TaxID=1768011 RepID=UPI003C7CEC18